MWGMHSEWLSLCRHVLVVYWFYLQWHFQEAGCGRGEAGRTPPRDFGKQASGEVVTLSDRVQMNSHQEKDGLCIGRNWQGR